MVKDVAVMNIQYSSTTKWCSDLNLNIVTGKKPNRLIQKYKEHHNMMIQENLIGKKFGENLT